MGAQVTELIRLLQDSLDETLRVLAVLSEAELDDASDHPCAMGGSFPATSGQVCSVTSQTGFEESFAEARRGWGMRCDLDF